MPIAHPMTADEFLARPETRRSLREELIAGELVVHEPLPLHQIVTGDILGALMLWTREAPQRGLAILPLDVQLDDRNVYAPDVLWYAEGRAPGRDGGRPSPVPDIAVEVRSPSTWRDDVRTKKAVYERRGLPELWLVDTVAECVLVFRRSNPPAARFDVTVEFGRAATLTSPLLPGFALAIADLFGD